MSALTPETDAEEFFPYGHTHPSDVEASFARRRYHSPEIDEQAVKLLAEHKERRGGEK